MTNQIKKSIQWRLDYHKLKFTVWYSAHSTGN